jgi:L-iditol 2-dehydrogenase
MKQAVMITPGKIEFKEIDPPQPRKGEVLLKIQRIGVCGSDLHVWHGKHPYTKYPVIQGHEYSATVAEIGKGVKNISIGDKVTAIPQIVCGKCGPCKRGDYHICENLKVEGFQAPGVAQDYFVTKVEKIVVLPSNFSYEQGAFVEPVSVAVHAVRRIENIKDKRAVVFGAGPIGNLVAQVLQAYGAKVLITDLSDHRIKIAEKCGIKNTFNTKDKKTSDAVKENLGLEGFNLAFECVGVEPTMRNAIENIEKGGKIVVVGVFAENPRINIGFVQDRELNIIGTLMYKRDDYIEAVSLIDSERIKIKPLFSKHFDFFKYNEAYNFIEKERDKIMKVFIDVN